MTPPAVAEKRVKTTSKCDEIDPSLQKQLLLLTFIRCLRTALLAPPPILVPFYQNSCTLESSAILWLVKFHPDLSDGQISKLVGTTKNTIQSIRQRSHWNINNIQAIDPVALGLCQQVELDTQVVKANKKNKLGDDDDDKLRIVSTEQSLEQ